MKKIILVMTISFISLIPIENSIQAQESFLGEIKMFAGTFAPRGWAFCEGQTLPINSNTALFSLLGTTYGGDGRTTFNLPDLRGRAPVHPGTINSESNTPRVGTALNGTKVIKGDDSSELTTQSTLRINYIICLSGMYPSRN